MSGVQISVEAKLDSADIDKVVKELSDQIGRMGQGVAQANKVKYNPFNRQVFSDGDKLEAQLKRILALHQQIAKINPAINLGGTPGTGGTVSPTVLPPPPAPTAPPASPTPSPSPQNPASPGQRPRQPPGQWWNNRYRNPFNHTWGGRIVGAGLNAMGPMGGVASGALNSAYVGGGGSFLSGGALSAGFGALLGGGLALGISKAIGGVMEKIGAAQNDAIGYDTLKRTLGDVNVSFDALRLGLHAASDAIDVTYPEVLKLGSEFAHISGMASAQSTSLANEVRIGGGFGRSFGVDPSQSVAFFAQMRQFGITSNPQDSQKLALTIGEAIAKSGAFSKADEVLQAIASFATQQTRLGLTAANTTGYASEFSGLMGARIPGLDAVGTANLLSRVNGAISNGGNVGEAGLNFTYRAIGGRLGLDPIQTQIQMENGAFGTGAQTFGGKTWAAFAKKFGVATPGAASRSTATNLQMVMDQMQKVYAGRPELMLDAMHRYFGTSYGQSMALATVAPERLGGLQSALAASGVDLKNMSSTGISAMAQIANGDRGTLNEQASSLWSRLSGSDAKSLTDSANSGDDEKLRSTLLQLTAKYGQEQTDGDKTRKSIQDLDKDMMDAAGKMVSPLNTIRDTLMLAFGKRGNGMMTSDDIHKAVVQGQKDTVNERADARIAKAKGQLAAVNAVDDYGRPIDPKGQKQAYDNLQSETAAANKDRADALAKIDGGENPTTQAGATNTLPLPKSLQGGTSSSASGNINLRNDPGLIAQLADTDRIDGLMPGTAYAQMMAESSFNSNARSKVGAMGLSQVMPKTLAALEKKLGRKLDPSDKNDAVLIQRELMGENMHKFGNQADALRAYNSGWDKGKWNNPETNAYVSKIMENSGMYAFGMPSGAKAPTSPDKQTFSFEHNITLQNQNGAPVAPPITVSKQVGPPKPAGTSNPSQSDGGNWALNQTPPDADYYAKGIRF